MSFCTVVVGLHNAVKCTLTVCFQTDLHAAESWVWAGEQLSLCSWRSMTHNLRQHSRQHADQRDNGTHGCLLPEEALGDQLWAVPSPSRPPLPPPHRCPSGPHAPPRHSLHTADKNISSACENTSTVSLFNTLHYTKNRLEQVCPCSPLLAFRGDPSSSSSSSSRFFCSLLPSARRRERSEKSSADYTKAHTHFIDVKYILI